jgi:uncharacterized lipoprotein YmbA
MRFRSCVLVLPVVLAACASSPRINYYTLGAVSSGTVAPSINLVVERFRTSEALGRAQLMIATRATEVEYYAADQWAGGLGELVQHKLAAEFGPKVAGRRTLIVTGQVLACEQVEIQKVTQARLKLRVVVRDAELKRYQGALFEKAYEARRTVASGTPSAVVDELSRCAEQIAAQIAADAAAHVE